MRHFLKLPNFTVCVVRRHAAMLHPAPHVHCPVRLDSVSSPSPTGQLVQSDWTSRRLELSRATKSGGKAQGVGFRGPPEEATMAGQPFQEHLMGRDIQDLLCRREAPDLVS